MENKSHALAAGAFVVAVAALLVALAFWLTRDKGSYDKYELSTKDAVSGLQPQAAVRYKGVAVGKVTAIGFDPDTTGNVRIRIAVDEKTPISPNTYATLSYQGITGLAFVQLDDAKAPVPPVPPGSNGIPRLSLQTSQLGKLTEQLPQILVQVEQATARINDILSPANQKVLIGAIDNIGKAAGNISQLTTTLGNTVVTRLDPALAAFPALVTDTSKTMHALKTAANDVSGSANAIRTTAQRLNEKGGALDKLAEGTESLAFAADTFAASTLPRVNRVTDDTARAARQLSRAVNGINDNPQSLIFGNGGIQPGPGEQGFTAPAVGTTGSPP